MSGRGLRVRAAVNYNDKQDMEPAWMKEIQSVKSSTPPKKSSKKSSKDSQGSAEKENSKEKKSVAKPAKAAKEQAPQAQEAQEPVAKAEKPKKTPKAAKEPKVAARGRNVGLKVVPIVDQKRKTPKVSGLRKQQAAATTLPDSPESPSPVALPKPPSQPKEVPGLPGIVQKAAPAGSKPVTERPGSAKRKASLPDTDVSLPSERHASPPSQPQTLTSKRQRQESFPAPAPAARVAPAPHSARKRQLPPSPGPLALSPLPAENIADQLEEMRANFAALADLCEQLQEENVALKEARLRDDVEEVVAQQTEHVLEHGRKASELAQHWKEEAQRMSELVDQLRGGALQEEMRTLHADLATARQALLDMNVAKAQQDKALVELQKRNKFLERHARIPTTLDKCVGTDPPPAVDTWVQVPHGIELYQARAFVPEGAAGSSLYTHGEGAGHGHTARAAVEASYTLQAQRTMAQGAGGSFSGSDMRLASGPQVRGHGMPPTGESVQGQQAGRRRMSAPPAPLLGPDGMPRQIQFYSTSGPSAPLPPVAEHGEEEEHVVAAVPAAEAELLAACGMVGTVAGSTARYTHAGTGFCFEVRPAPPDSEADAEGGEKHDWHYHLVNLGAAEPVLQQVPTLGPYLTSDFAFGAAMREFLVRSIAEGLAAAGYR